jgi:hypothetical protein
MARMWELPTREVPGPRGEAHGLWPADYALALRLGGALGTVRHAITRHRISAAIRAGQPVGVAPADPDRLRWARPAELATLPLTGLARKVLARIAPEGAPRA